MILLFALLCAATNAAANAINASKLSEPYRNWHYYVGPYNGFVVPPNAGDFPGQSLTDTAIVYQKSAEDKLPGQWRMTYLFFNQTKGSNGYEAALATSSDLLHWQFGQGGDRGLVFPRSDLPGMNCEQRT